MLNFTIADFALLNEEFWSRCYPARFLLNTLLRYNRPYAD